MYYVRIEPLLITFELARKSVDNYSGLEELGVALTQNR